MDVTPSIVLDRPAQGYANTGNANKKPRRCLGVREESTGAVYFQFLDDKEGYCGSPEYQTTADRSQEAEPGDHGNWRW